MRKKYILIFLLLAGFSACKKDELQEVFNFRKPAHFPEPVYDFTKNPVTKEKFELGRTLFYDPILSRDLTISCASCHIPSSAFTQHGHSVSHGIEDRLGTRNSMPIMNLAWSTGFMWDGGVFDLDLQPIAPITNHEEMDDNMENVLQKLNASEKYRNKFKDAFGVSTITGVEFFKAFSQFMLMCVSSQSKYDKVIQKQSGFAFTADENAGYLIYRQKCSDCHKEPLFTDFSFRNNGIGTGTIDDKGRSMVTWLPEDDYKFKVPSLRNLSYTSPYMHDGRFFTLDAVLEHYNSKVSETPNLDPLLHQNGTLGIPLSDLEKTQLKAFLKTLDDAEFIIDEKLAEQ